MARYDVRVQLQSGNGNVDSKGYHSADRPCTKREALQLLESLWESQKDYYRDAEWKREFKAAIENAQRAVNNARNASAGENRNLTSQQFKHDGATFRVDVAIEAGEGHFSD